MFKEYYCVLLIMDKLFKSRQITTLTEYYWVINHNGLNCWTTKMDTFYYLEGSEVYRASTPEMQQFLGKILFELEHDKHDCLKNITVYY